MQLPTSLRRAIESHAQGQSISSLAQAATRMSAIYRGGPIPRQTPPAYAQTGQNRGEARAKIGGQTEETVNTASAATAHSAVVSPENLGVSSRILTTDLDRIAYLVTRMPATYVASHAVFSAIRELLPELSLETVLDLGAGPGTASWAAAEVFPETQSFTLLEKDQALAALGKSLAAQSAAPALQSGRWVGGDLTSAQSFPAGDLVMFSYSIGEIDAGRTLALLDTAWRATRKVLAIIEPGTPAGFARVRWLRDELLRRGGNMIAPCPHCAACPMTGDEWCHFAARLERSSLHRRVKGGTLGYEDEKYSYVAVSKAATAPAQARIIRHPQHHPGFVELQLCTTQGLREVIVSRKHRDEFRRAKKSLWGSAWQSEAVNGS